MMDKSQRIAQLLQDVQAVQQAASRAGQTLTTSEAIQILVADSLNQIEASISSQTESAIGSVPVTLKDILMKMNHINDTLLS
jgi:hypothetical protein